MKRSSLLYALIPLSALLAGGHYVGGVFGFYLDFPFYDKVMHFIAGSICALTVLFVLSAFHASAPLLSSQRRILFSVVIGALSIGVAWEVFEYIYDITFSTNYMLDTGGDLIMDVFGALVTGQYVFKKGFTNNRTSTTLLHG